MDGFLRGYVTLMNIEKLITYRATCNLVKQQLHRCLFMTSQCHQREKSMNIFDRQTKKHQKNVAATLKDSDVYDYLKDEVATRLVDRIQDVSRFFEKALDLGCGKGHVGRLLSKDDVGLLYQSDMSPAMLAKCGKHEIPTINVNADEEFLPFKENTFNLIVSNLSLHWVNDLPGCLKQVLLCMREDAPFIASMFGGDTLYQLRSSLQLAEMEREGGFAPRISPFAEMRDVGNLLSRAGFSLITVDCEDITIYYPSMFELMKDLKGMGESNCAWNRKSVLHRGTQKTAASIYKEYYGNEDGHIPATFHILYMIGWKPSASQGTTISHLKDYNFGLKCGSAVGHHLLQNSAYTKLYRDENLRIIVRVRSAFYPKPLERGSATVSLKDLDDVLKNPPKN